jgi:hypothetical protein
MKVALCFIISYEHILNKEEIWKTWIEPNKDIINVYFYYKDINKIKSSWIINHSIPPDYIHETTYYHVIPAYLSILSFALKQDSSNQWFCLLTDSCCPIVSPRRFRYMFFNYYNKTLLSWKRAWWNISFHKRANLQHLPSELHLGNDPWFVMKRENVLQTMQFVKTQQPIVKTICDGGLANESLFAIIMCACKQLETNSSVISATTHLTDWNRMSSFTSPHTFKDANSADIKFIDTELDKNKYALFIRKMAPEFPDDILRNFIYEKNKHRDDDLVIVTPPLFIYLKIKYYLYYCYYCYYFYYFGLLLLAVGLYIAFFHLI